MIEDGFDEERDEIDVTLAVLHGLLGRIASPVVRTCLEEARDGIAHLTGRDSPDQRAAA
jgi:hypothetical protein